MNPKLTILFEFITLIGRLAQAASRNDTQSFIGIISLLERLCSTARQNLTYRVVDPQPFDDVDDDLL